MASGEPAVVVRGLRKVYGDLEAVAGIDLTIERGEVFALLGPNGAGKTTTVLLRAHAPPPPSVALRRSSDRPILQRLGDSEARCMSSNTNLRRPYQ